MAKRLDTTKLPVCSFKGKCSFKKLNRKRSSMKFEIPRCVFDGRCNQQNIPDRKLDAIIHTIIRLLHKITRKE